ncbi:MAG: spore germination protein [Oscillospiraceae bacterium]|nr:spore germination protein [Oscillospiraceae bacterium]
MKYRVYDGVAAACLLTLPALLYTGLRDCISMYGTAAWLAMLAAVLPPLLLFPFLALLMKRHEGKNLIEVSASVIGRPLTALYGIVLGAYCAYRAGIHARECAEILKQNDYKFMPVYVIIGVIILSALVMNFYGQRTIFKCAGFFFALLIIGVLFVVLLGLNRYDYTRLFPIFGNHERFFEFPQPASIYDGVFLLALFAPGFKSARAFRASGLLSVIIAGVAAAALCACYIMMFPMRIAASTDCGFIEVGKSAYYNHFFYRFESLLLFFLIFSSAMYVTLGILAAKESVSRCLNIKHNKIVVTVCAAGAGVAALIPSGLGGVQPHLAFLRDYGLFFLAGAPLVILLIYGVKRLFKWGK